MLRLHEEDSLQKLQWIVESDFCQHIKSLTVQADIGERAPPNDHKASDNLRDALRMLPHLKGINFELVDHGVMLFGHPNGIGHPSGPGYERCFKNHWFLDGMLLHMISTAISEFDVKLEGLTISRLWLLPKFTYLGEHHSLQNLSSKHLMFLSNMNIEYQCPYESDQPQLSFLEVLRHTSQLRSLTLRCGDMWLEEEEYDPASVHQRSLEIMQPLAQDPVFSLQKLELSNICANSEHTFARIFSAHARTLKSVTLEEFELHAPNTLRDFYSALAELNLTYYQTSSFRHFNGNNRGGYLHAALFSDTIVRDEVLDWRSGSTMDRTYKGWVLHSRKHKDTDEPLVYDSKKGYDVKHQMREIVAMIDCGALR